MRRTGTAIATAFVVVAASLTAATTAAAQESGSAQVWHQGGDVAGAIEPLDHFGREVVVGDFDGDGVEDLVVGVGGEGIGVHRGGAINVLYGSDGVGLTTAGNQIFSQAGPIPGTPELDDGFGSVMASGDFNDDGFDDLAVTAWGEFLGNPSTGEGYVFAAGLVSILYGSADGLSDENSISMHYGTGTSDEPERSDQFGYALAAADFDNNGFDDLAVGVRGRGHIKLFDGGLDGIAPTRQRVLAPDKPDEDIGLVLAVGDFNGDTYPDLASGGRSHVPNFHLPLGQVAVFSGSSSSLAATPDLWLSQSGDFPGKAENGDAFGAYLATGDVNGDGYDDLAIGVPGEDIGDVRNAGIAQIALGTADGLTAEGAITLSQAGPAHGLVEADDGYGSSVAVGDLNNDGYDDVIIGTPREDIGATTEAGAIAIAYGSPTGPSSADQIGYRQGAGLPGSAERNDHMGFELATGDFDNNGRDEAIIGVFFEGLGPHDQAGMVIILEP